MNLKIQEKLRKSWAPIIYEHVFCKIDELLAYDVLAKAVKGMPEEERTDTLAKVLEPDFKTDILYRAKAEVKWCE